MAVSAIQTTVPPLGDPPPWSQPPIDGGPARAVALAIWQESGNRDRARLLLPADTLLTPETTTRPARIDEGWAVAWDSPGLPGLTARGERCSTCGRGVMGIAAIDLIPNPSRVRASPVVMEWNDGGLAGLGNLPDEGRWIADILLPGQQASYQLWTYVGRDHLDYLVSQLRYVTGGP